MSLPLGRKANLVAGPRLKFGKVCFGGEEIPICVQAMDDLNIKHGQTVSPDMMLSLGNRSMSYVEMHTWITNIEQDTYNRFLKKQTRETKQFSSPYGRELRGKP